MADDEPQQTPTPAKTPVGKKPKRPSAPERVESEVSTTEDDQGYESRSRSQSRRRRRQNQRQRTAQAKAQSGDGNAQSMASIDEGNEPQQQLQRQQPQEQNLPPKQYVDKKNPQWLKNPSPQDITEEQPFEYIKPPGQSMIGPVTYARMLRGEIPWRGPPPSQPLETAQAFDAKDSSGKDPMDQDGLKLRIELNLDIEIELKAHIHGDLTLALLA